MSVIHSLEHKQAKKRAKELKEFLLELDLICDKLYNRLDFKGTLEALMKLEDVRVHYYTEFFEYDRVVTLRRKLNDK